MRTTIVKAVRWQNFDEVRGMFKDADSVDGYVVFNIRHNRYRLIAVIHYAKTSDERQTQGHVYIRSFLTHKEFHGHLLPLAEPRAFTSWLRVLFRHDWVVYAKRPSGGPEHALRYLGAYTHRVAISNSRLVALSEGNVTFRWRDSAHGNKKQLMTLPVDEFLRCFLLHLLPRGFIRIRNFGFLANRPSGVPSTLFPLAPAIRSASSRRHIARAAHSLAVAMSALQRNHAGCRSLLRRALLLRSPPNPRRCAT